MSDLLGNHIVGFPMRRLNYINNVCETVQEAKIRKRRNQKEIPTPKTEVGKTELTIMY